MTLLVPETELEARIMADPEWQAGIKWGKPRSGHDEGSVGNHIEQIFTNINRGAWKAWVDDIPIYRGDLRVIALTHDTMKYQVDEKQQKHGHNHHGWLARKFAERYVTDPAVLEVIELHDEAFNAWYGATRKEPKQGRKAWEKAEVRLTELVKRLGQNLPLYIAFFCVDNESPSKSMAPFAYFLNFTWDYYYD